MNQPHPAPYTPTSESFPALIRAMESLLERLLAVSERQLMFVQNGDDLSLERLLGHKLKLFDERERIARRLDPYRDIPEDERRWNSETEKQETRAARDRCEQLLAEILRFDGQSLQIGEERIEAIKNNLRYTRQESRVHTAYSKQKKV